MMLSITGDTHARCSWRACLGLNVSIGSNSDVDTHNWDVGFTPMSGHRQPGRSGPKSAMKRYRTFKMKDTSD
jgi:hypothetical protein